MKPGPSRNDQFLMAMSDLPAVTSEPAPRQSPLTQRDDRENAEDADQDEGAFDDASGDVSECDGFVLSLQQREEHHCASDVADDEEQLEERTYEHAGVSTGTGDVVGIAQDRSVRELSDDRSDKGEDEQHAHDERGLSRGGHVDVSLRVG